MNDITETDITETDTTRPAESEPSGPPAEPEDRSKAEALVAAATAAASDKKGIEPVVLDVSQLLRIVDFFVIVSGANRRQVSTIVDEIDDKVKEAGFRPLRKEGADEGEWVLIDYGDVVVHVFLDEIRRFYDLERLWGDAPRRDIAEA